MKKRIKKRGPRIRGLGSDAVALGVRFQHLSAVLHGARESRRLVAAYWARRALREDIQQMFKAASVDLGVCPRKLAGVVSGEPWKNARVTKRFWVWVDAVVKGGG